MNNLQIQSAEQEGPTGGGPFNWPRLAIWTPGVLIVGTIAARVAVDAQFYFAPLVIFPLLTGIGLGGLLIALMRFGQIGNRPTIISGIILGALTATIGQHYFFYLSARDINPEQTPLVDKARQAFPELVPERLQAPPTSFMEYMHRQADRGRPLLLGYTARGRIAWLSWIIDGLLILAGALMVAIPAMLLPFCSRCQTWYRAIRSMHISSSTIRRLSQIIGVEPVEDLKSGRCRLICCRCGCGPTGCELYWEDTTENTFFARVWLDAALRNQVMHILDQVTLPENNGAE